MRRGTILWIVALVYFKIGAAPLVAQAAAAAVPAPAAAGQTSGQAGAAPAPAAATNAPANAGPISLDLAVANKHNKPVLDLKAGEVTVDDNGKPAKLTELRLVNGNGQDGALITLLFERPGMEDSERSSEDALFATSASAAKETSKKLRQEASKLLRAFPDGTFRFAVVDVWGRLQIQEEEATNPKAVEEAVAGAVEPKVYGANVEANALEQRLVRLAKTGRDTSGAAANVGERTLARTMYTAMQTSGRIAKDQHLSLTQASLLALVEAQQALPGRKAIVYFMSVGGGNGDPYHRSGRDAHAKEALKSIIGAANRAGVNIYVVLQDELENAGFAALNLNNGDLRVRMAATTGAAMGPMTPGQAAAINNDAISYASGPAPATPSDDVVTANEDMLALSKHTGGTVLFASGNMTKPVKEMVRGLTTYYKASFIPPAGVDDGTFHTTAFRALRKGLKVRGRTGYLAMPPSAGIADPIQPFEVPLMALLKRQELPAELDYRAQVLKMEHADAGAVGLVALEAPVSGLEVRTDQSTRLSSAHVSVLAIVKDSSGTEIERFSEDIARRWSAASGAGTAPAFISFERSFAAPPGTYVLETAILDNNSGKAAAKWQTFTIADSRQMPELSDLMVVRGMEPADNGSGEPDMLWRGEQRVLPNLYGELPAGAHNVSVFLLAHTDPKLQKPATVKLEVLRDGTPLRGKPLTAGIKAGDEFSALVQGFAISSAANGEYELRVTLEQGGQTAVETGKFVLTGEGERIASGRPAAGGDAPISVDPPGMSADAPAADRLDRVELDRILDDARKNALAYGDALPNLVCEQTTQRLYDASGMGDWKLKDTIVEQLAFVNHEEDRVLVGQKTAGDEAEVRISSTGEFGAAMTNIFRPEAKAKFTWKETATLRGEPAEVFDYRVDHEDSAFLLNDPPAPSVKVGYHGRIYIDRATHGVMSLSIITDEAPKNFPIRKAAVRVDYDYVAINEHDYLLPVSAQVVTRLPGGSLSGDLLKRNDIAFTNFRRFGSSAKIVGVGTEEAPE